MKLLIIAGLLSLAGCADDDPREVDQCLRHERFQQCMKSLPAGPTATRYNDWDEVVAECGRQAYYQSLRKRSQIKLECQP